MNKKEDYFDSPRYFEDIAEWKSKLKEFVIEAKNFDNIESSGFTDENGLMFHFGQLFTGAIKSYGWRYDLKNRELSCKIEALMLEDSQKSGTPKVSPSLIQDLIDKGWLVSFLYGKKHYVNGLLHGSLIEYFTDDENMVFREIMFNQGKRLWITRYHFNGQLAHHLDFHNDRPHGRALGYHRDGQLSVEEYYADGHLEGRRLMYWPNGQLRTASEFKSGKKCGMEKEYSENGCLIKENEYDAEVSSNGDHGK